MGYGDELMAAGQAQRIYDADPSKRVAICDKRNRPRWSNVWDGNPILARPDEVAAGERVHKIKHGCGCRPYLRYPFTRSTGWRFTTWRAAEHRGRLYLTDEERAPGDVLAAHGPYIVIEPSPTVKTVNRIYPWPSWAVVRTLLHDVPCVQPVHEGSELLPRTIGAAAPGFRAICGFLAGAAVYVGTEGGLAHAAAALGIPAVVVFGGCISVEALGYPDHWNFADTGPRSPCGRWRPCPHCADAMERITPQMIAAAVYATLATARPRAALEEARA